MVSNSKSTTLKSNSGHSYTLTASFQENSVNVANNTSNITCTATLQAPSGVTWSSAYSSTLAIYWYDYKNKYDQLVAVIYPTSISAGGTLTVSGTIDVTHLDNGTLQGHSYAVFTKGGNSSYTPNSGGVYNDDTYLTTIARGIGIDSITQVARSNSVYATIGWTDNGNQVTITCEEITDSNEYVGRIHTWTNQKGNSGTTYSLTSSERQAYDNKGRNKIRWVLTTVVDGVEMMYTYRDFDYYRATTPALSDFGIGDSVKITTSRQRSSYTHRLSVSVGTWNKTLSTSAGTSYTWDTSTDVDGISQANTAYSEVDAVITARTYYSGALIGTKSTTVKAKFSADGFKPVFSDFDCTDGNSNIVTLMGANNRFVQGKSTLTATVSSANKMVAQSYATGDKYIATSNWATATGAYSTNDSVAMSLGTVTSDDSQETTVSSSVAVRAVDSRGLSTSVSKNITIWIYHGPTIDASITRENGFETQTTLKIAGAYKPLLVTEQSGWTEVTTAKNSIKSVRYRVKHSSTTTWGDWESRPVTYPVTNGEEYTTTDYVINLDNSYEWDVQVEVSDSLSTVTQDMRLAIGKPVLFVGTSKVGVGKKPSNGMLDVDGDVYASGNYYQDGQPLMSSHVGQVIMSTKLDTAEKVKAIYGGTWRAWGAGRVPVAYSDGDTEFGTVNATGGAKTHTLTVAQMPTHAHDVTWGDNVSSGTAVSGSNGIVISNSGSGSSVLSINSWSWANNTAHTAQKSGDPNTGGNIYAAKNGGGNAHNNLQPYKVIYMWERTA